MLTLKKQNVILNGQSKKAVVDQIKPIKKSKKKIKKLLTLLIGFDILVTQLVNRNLKKMIFEN